MKKNQNIVILGGDSRQRRLKKVLEAAFKSVTDINDGSEEKALSSLLKADIVILPIPFSKDKRLVYTDNSALEINKSKALQCLRKDTVVFGGDFTTEDRDFFEEEGIEYHDMLLNEGFLLENAYLTAEGAFKLLYMNTEETVFNKNVLITGYGRISELLSSMLSELKMNVTICARNEIQLKNAEKKGYGTVRLSELKNLKKYDFIFNTVPYRIFDVSTLETAEKCTYFELASAPFGADKDEVIGSGVNFVGAASLPGRFFPETSARLIADYILSFV